LPATTLVPFFKGVGDMGLTFSTAFHVDQRPDYGARLEHVGTFIAPATSARRFVNAS
jgi:hypothetical protein